MEAVSASHTALPAGSARGAGRRQPGPLTPAAGRTSQPVALLFPFVCPIKLSSCQSIILVHPPVLSPVPLVREQLHGSGAPGPPRPCVQRDPWTRVGGTWGSRGCGARAVGCSAPARSGLDAGCVFAFKILFLGSALRTNNPWALPMPLTPTTLPPFR